MKIEHLGENFQMGKIGYIPIVILIISLNFNLQSWALPEGPFPDAVFNRNIKTVQFYKEGWEFSYPILMLNDDKHLLLSFDDLDVKSKTYNYTIIHCDAEWMQSRVSSAEYINGFVQNTITNYESSISTSIPYIHYSLKIPNENIELKLSGNYIVLIYEDNNEDKPILMKRFVVSEQVVDINAEVRQPVLPKYMDNYQEVNFTISHPAYQIENPHQNIKVNIVKNNQWKFSVSDIKPMFIRDNKIVYENNEKNMFPGGNEYRSFDLKSLKYQSANIKSIDFNDGAYHVILKPEKPRNRSGYFNNEDLNGKYLIENQQGNTPENDAEYVYVHLSLSLNEPLENGDVYVVGGFSDNNCYDDNKMVFNNEHSAYEIDLLVKQGYYNYQYWSVKQDSGDVDETYFEGSYFETENDYAIYIYYCPYGSRYDHLIGVKLINSLKRGSQK